MRISRPWLWAGAIAGLVVLLVAIAAAQLLDERRVRREIEARLTALVGRPVHVRGALDYSLVPAVEFDVRDVQVDAWPAGAGAAAGGAAGSVTRGAEPAAPPAATEPPLLAIGRVHGSLAATSLVAGRIEIGDVQLEHVRVALAVDAAGRANWEGLFPDAPPGTPPAEPTRWALASLAITDLAIDRRDARDGSHQALREARVRFGRVELPEPFDVQLEGRVFEKDVARAMLTLSARAALDPEHQRYGLDAVAIDAKLDRASDGAALPLRLAATRLDYAAAGGGTAAVRGMTVESSGLRARLELAVDSLDTAPRASGTFALEPFVPRDVAKALAIELPPTADAKVLGRADFAGGIAYGAGRIELQHVQAGLDDTRFGGDVGIALDPREYRFELTADRIVADRYLKPKRLRDRSPVRLPLDFLRGWPATGRLRIGELVVQGNVLKGVTIDLGAVAQGDAR